MMTEIEGDARRRRRREEKVGEGWRRNDGGKTREGEALRLQSWQKKRGRQKKDSEEVREGRG